MEIRELGEFGLIEKLSRIIESSGTAQADDGSLLIGVGDDAAAWRAGEGEIQLGTTDMLVQDIHFRLDHISWYDLGWKSLAANISDIAAMGGIPRHALISLALPAETTVESVADLYQGLTDIARRFGMSIAGGNLAESPIVVISITVIGSSSGSLLVRSGARPGDLIAVTGYLGGSAAGLNALQNRIESSEYVDTLRLAHFRPDPRVATGNLLAACGVKAAIDISDGLLADLGHICQASGVEAVVRSGDIPVHPAAKAVFGERSLDFALSGGEDYELLFTASPDIMRDVARKVPSPVTIIGEIGKGEAGKVILLDQEGRPVDYHRGGWQHFANPDRVARLTSAGLPDFEAVTFSPDQTQAIGQALGELALPGDLILLAGDLGTGKTCFTQGFARGAGFDGYVSSPSFVLMREYDGRVKVFHIDLYRLDHIEEVADLGIDDTLAGGGVVVIEWADKALDWFPREHLLIEFTHEGEDRRRVRFESRGSRYAGMLDELKKKWNWQ